MKKWLSMLILAALALGMAPASSLAEEADTIVFAQVDDGFSAQMNTEAYRIVHDAILEAINVDVQPAYFPSDQYWNRVNMMLASGDQLDIITRVSQSDAKQFLADGLILDLTDIIAEKVPNYLAVCETYPAQETARIEAQIDGRDVGFPMVATMLHANSFQIRTDWLEALGMDMPETVEDFEAYLEAVKTQDPDGNGVDDTYGLCGAVWGGDVVSTLAYSYLPVGNNWWLDENGDLAHPGLHPNYKALLGKVIEWQEKGYLPPEALLSADDQRLDWFVNNQIGAVAGWYSAPIAGRVTLVEKIPEANYEPLNLVGLEDAANALQNEKSYSHLNVVTHTANIDAVARFYNYMYTEDGWRMIKWGVEGVSFQIVDGQPESIKDENGANVCYGCFNPQMQTYLDPYGFFPGNAYNLVLYRELTAALDALPGFDIPDKLVSYSFTGTDSEMVIADLDTYIAEQQALVLAGERPLDDWDSIMQTWLEMGGDQYTADRNAQYHEQIG